MANLSITSTCNQSCDYCFARDAFGPNAAGKHMSLPLFDRALDFLERSQIDQVRLLGGEPTLHPHFQTLVERIMERELNLLVFSNGKMPDAVRQYLTRIPKDRILILMNLTSGRTSGSWEADTDQTKTMAVLGPRVMPGINIYQPDLVLDGLLDAIRRFRLQPAVRIGLAQPNLSRSNRFLHPKDYPRAGRHLFTFGQSAADCGVKLEFDCGFVPCMFPEQAQDLPNATIASIGRRCNPILDVLPDGTVASCYPLTGLAATGSIESRNADDLRSELKKHLAAYRQIGIYRHCSACPWFHSKHCHGGCLATAMARLRPAPPRSFQPIERSKSVAAGTASPGPAENDKKHPSPVPPETTDWVLPYIDQPMAFWRDLAAKYGEQIREVYAPLPLEGVGSGRPPQAQPRLTRFLEASPLKVSVLINPVILPKPADQLKETIIRTLEDLCRHDTIRGVTVANPDLGRYIRRHFNHLELTASVLMDIHTPHQVAMIAGIFDHLVPAGRIMRDTAALKQIRQAFDGRIRLMVNEACLPGCPYRTQHFFEMAHGSHHPQSLCDDLLAATPWMRLTGAWVLPQHLDLYDGLYDDLKIAGRVTLNAPDKYLQVLDAYVHGRPLTPDAIGGGPASVKGPVPIDRDFFARTLKCRHQCHQCDLCRQYYRKAVTHGS